MRLTHLQRLEAESIHIMREVVAECERPVMLYSIGKDSAVLLHLAHKAFHPSPPPFPLLQQSFEALDMNGFDAAFGDERGGKEKSRAPEFWQLYNARKHEGESIRVFPLSNWTELDVWQYIHLEHLPMAASIEPYLDRHENKSLLRFITCGGSDDGKGTLIGRLLHESKAELEQGTAIGAAYRFFSTERRRFIIADATGDEPHARDMVSGASTADAAILLVDARKGVLTQTRRHSTLLWLIGVRKIVLAVDQMDRVAYAEPVLRAIEHDYRAFAKEIGLEDITPIPLSVLRGDNIAAPSENTPWYRGPALMAYLETVDADASRDPPAPFRFPVQWVNHPNDGFLGYSGTVAGGSLEPGERIRIQPSGRESRIARIVTAAGDLPLAVAGQSVTLTLEDEIDVSRGDVISSADSPAEVADQFEATLVWMSEQAMLPGRSYLLKISARTLSATITEPKYRLNLDTLEHVAARKLEINEIGVCNLALDRPVAFDPYRVNRKTGAFILIDRMSNHTIGAGMLHFALRRSHNLHRQHLDVDRQARARLKGQRPAVLWFTGLSGAGKSTIANCVEKKLHAMGRHTYLLDGDNVRHGLNKDLGFTEADRVENIRRVAEVARLMVDAGLVVLTAFISPFRAERALARSLFADGEFVEVYVDTPLQVAEQRDVKGLYSKARRGDLRNFTGVDSPYEPPEAPELRVDTVEREPEQAAELVIACMREFGLLE
jgi:bifunctional enzyme CysN/CysC